MDLRALEDQLTGSRIVRVAHRPHEIRVRLLRPTDPSIWLCLEPAGTATVDVLLPDATITGASAEESDGRVRIQLLSADGVALTAIADSWSWHPYDRDEGLWNLADDEKAAVRRAVEAVVARDAASLAPMLPPDWTQPAEDFWMWAIDSDDVPVNLLLPPPPFDDWEGSVLRLPADTEVVIDFLNADDPTQLIDLTLELTLTRTPDGALHTHVHNLHTL
ncbi:hypothetical protein [Kribbella deserti]|uniref:DUF2470 domain-containing protein n=1 Tax=Kribbella deserti TaxID=1926257 RepID=A0ABV6QQN2_9ACTN